MTKLVYGVGVNDRKYPTTIKGRTSKEYIVWKGLLARCYCASYQKRYPTYLGCSASENFKNYSYFYEWCQTQIGFDRRFELDKDLLLKNNKVYSEQTCVFLPSQLNKIILKHKAARGNLPIGVSLDGEDFKTHCYTDAPSTYVGAFKTIAGAFQAYKQAKEAHIKTQAEKWKAHIDPRAFAALMAYEVSISD